MHACTNNTHRYHSCCLARYPSNVLLGFACMQVASFPATPQSVAEDVEAADWQPGGTLLAYSSGSSVAFQDAQRLGTELGRVTVTHPDGACTCAHCSFASVCACIHECVCVCACTCARACVPSCEGLWAWPWVRELMSEVVSRLQPLMHVG